MTPKTRRREFLGGLAAGVAATTVGREAAQATAQQGTAVLKIIDFHNHFVGPAFTSIAGAAAPAEQRAHFDTVNRNLSDPSGLLSGIEAAGIAARVVNTPLEFIGGADGDVPTETVMRINDQLAELVAKNSGRLHGLATVDAYAGEAGALELIRAVRDLKLRGVFVAAAKGNLLIDAPEARPTLAAAAALGVPVFVHPVNDPQLAGRFARYGRLGTMFSRGTINAAALVALLESGAFETLSGLRVVVTTLAIGGLLIAGGFGDGRRLRREAPEAIRRHVFIDTMGLHPALIRAAVDLLGADHVLFGSDWPIFVENAVPQRLRAALTACGLGEVEQQMIAGGNALQLLGISS